MPPFGILPPAHGSDAGWRVLPGICFLSSPFTLSPPDMILFGKSQKQIEPKPKFWIIGIAIHFHDAIGDRRGRVLAVLFDRGFYRLVVAGLLHVRM